MMGIVFIEIVMFYEVISRYVFSRPTLWQMNIIVDRIISVFAPVCDATA